MPAPFESMGWVVFHGVVIVSLAALSFTAVLHGLLMPRLRPVKNAGERLPRVSILVPARNEEANIAACVRSLLAQDYPNFSVHVLDDHSTDQTARIVESLGLTREKGGLIDGAELPEGWVGKNWACHQLSRIADGEYLLFTDADTVHAPESVSALVHAAREHGVVLLSAWPRQVMKTWSEKLVVSLLPFVGGIFYPHGLLWVLGRYPQLRSSVPLPLRRLLGAANGQVVLFQRAGYEKIGGHFAVRDHLVEDIALGRAVAERMDESFWWLNCDSAGLIRCRMYRSFGEVWEGFSKNSRAAFENAHALFWGFGIWQAVVFVIPFLLPVCGRAGWVVYGEIGVLLALRAFLTGILGGSWWSVVFHPVAWGLGLAIGFNSWRRSRGLGVRWKGRTYAVRLDFASKNLE
jgi:chlorobactene glucosyltransferase